MNPETIITILLAVNAIWIVYRVRFSRYGLGLSLGTGGILAVVLYYFFKPKKLYIKYIPNIAIGILIFFITRIITKMAEHSENDLMIILSTIFVLLVVNIMPVLMDIGKNSAKREVINIISKELQVQIESARSIYNRISTAGLNNDLIEMKLIVDTFGDLLHSHKIIELVSMVAQNHLTFNKSSNQWRCYSATYNTTTVIDQSNFNEFLNELS